MKVSYCMGRMLLLAFVSFSHQVLAQSQQGAPNQENSFSQQNASQNQANGSQTESSTNSASQGNGDSLDSQDIDANSSALENGAEMNALQPADNKAENLGFGENPMVIDDAELPSSSAKLSQLPEANATGSNPISDSTKPSNIVDQGALQNPAISQPGGQIPDAGSQVANAVPTSATSMDSLEPLVTNEFTGAPPFPGNIKTLSEGEAPEFYKVEPGDTLTDVCDQLLDEPGYWPKLWSFNSEIKNPHFIWPGMNLKFYSGDEANPPYLQISNADSMVPTNSAGLSMASLVDSPFQIAPLPQKKVEQGFEIDPDSIVDVLDVTTDSSDIDYFGSPFVPTEMQVNIPAFIFEDTQSALGTVFTGVDANINAGVGNQVVIEDEDGLNPGTIYSVIRYSGKVSTFSGSGTVGYRYEYAGKITMQNKMNDDDYYLATVIESDRGIQPGDIIVPYIANRRSVPISDQFVKGSDASGEVVGFDFEESQIGATGNFVFIAGIKSSPGALVNLYRNTFGFASTREHNDLVNLQHAATAKILDVKADVATAYIVSSRDAVALGDRASSR
ncbi:MAG: LysM peptidoglycan-binding domain-containing protein [Pseudomonadota bacterium]